MTITRGQVAQDHENLVLVRENFQTVAQMATEIWNILYANSVAGLLQLLHW